MMNLKDYLNDVKDGSDIRMSNAMLKHGLQYLSEVDDLPAVLDGNHIRLHPMEDRDYKKYGVDPIPDHIYRVAVLHNYEYEPDIERKFSHIVVCISQNDLKSWIESL